MDIQNMRLEFLQPILQYYYCHHHHHKFNERFLFPFHPPNNHQHDNKNKKLGDHCNKIISIHHLQYKCHHPTISLTRTDTFGELNIVCCNMAFYTFIRMRRMPPLMRLLWNVYSVPEIAQVMVETRNQTTCPNHHSHEVVVVDGMDTIL
jgi:hypothetical protein